MEKTYVFDSPGTSGSGMDNSFPYFLAGMMNNNRGMDPGLLALLDRGNRNQDSWGGCGIWFIWIILLWFMRGNWFGNGNGFGNGLNGIPNTLNNDFGREVLLQAINGTQSSVNQLASSLNCDVNALQTAIGQVNSLLQSLGGQIGMSSERIINALQAGNNSVVSQLNQCCCNIQDSITRQGYENQIATSNQTNSLISAGTQNTTAIIAKLDAMQTQSLYDKIDALREQKSALAAQLSNEHQTAAIQAYQAQSLVPVNAALTDLSNRLASIECKQPATVTVPYIPAMSSLVPVSYSQPVNFGLTGYSSGCYCNGYGL